MTQVQQSPSVGDIIQQVKDLLSKLGDEPVISATVFFNVKQDRLAEFQRLATELTRATTIQIGCEEFSFNKHVRGSWEAPTPPGIVQYTIYERWESVGRFRRQQWESPHLTAFQTQVIELVEGFPDLRFYCDVPDVCTGPPAPVLRTGQTWCWDKHGKKVHCRETGQDGYYKAGVNWPARRFTDNGDGTVTDNRSRLTWLQDADYFHEVTWGQALLEKIPELNAGKYRTAGGDGEWRMPNVNELQSLLDLSNPNGPAIPEYKGVFSNLHPVNYWTSSSVALAPALGWYTALGVGPPVFDLKFNLMHMWPVKGQSTQVAATGQTTCWDPKDPMAAQTDCKGTGEDGALKMGAIWPDPRFALADPDDGTVIDRLTGLVWLRHADAFGTMTWQDALDACNSLAAGFKSEEGDFELNDDSAPGDWRLPNLNELRSLIDYERHTPALPKGFESFFRNVRPSLYWSSTTVASASNLARFVFVGVGPSVWDHKSVLLGVWPVKGGLEVGK